MDGWDAIVAGGGPAGSSTASYLGLRGRRALVLERERFPRFHLGESLLPFAADLFRELGVLDAIERRYLRKPGARFLHEESGARFTYYFDCAIDGGRPHAWQVPRADFDQLLLENARRLQAPLGGEAREEHAVRAVRFLEDAVEVEIEPRVGARYVERAPVFVDA